MSKQPSTEQRINVWARVTPGDKARLERLALAEGRSLSNYCARALEGVLHEAEHDKLKPTKADHVWADLSLDEQTSLGIYRHSRDVDTALAAAVFRLLVLASYEGSIREGLMTLDDLARRAGLVAAAPDAPLGR